MSRKAISAETIKDYHRSEYTSAAMQYFSNAQTLQGFWHGKLAAEIGLTGPVSAEHFDRLADGQDPFTGRQLIAHRSGKAVDDGREVAHRAAFDITIGAPKSVSLTAIHDPLVRQAHQLAAIEAATYFEQNTMAKMGGNRGAVTTGKWIVAVFEHDTARPVGGYPAPHLHTHFVLFNITVGADGTTQARAVETRELYNMQKAATRVYQNRLHMELIRAGYEVRRGKNLAPEIVGYTQEYLDSESPRNQRIQDKLIEKGLSGRRAAAIIALDDREEKINITPEELRALHQAHSELYGNQHLRVLELARETRARGPVEIPWVSPRNVVTRAITRLSERHSVIEHDGFRQQGGIVQNALELGQGKVTLESIQKEIHRRTNLTPEDQAKGLTVPELIKVDHYRGDAPGQRYATRDMSGKERTLIEYALSRRGQFEPINSGLMTKDWFRQEFSGRLNNAQLWMAWDAIHSKDQVFAVNGAAGSGKTRAMQIFADIAEAAGYEVHGLGPTTTARKELAKMGIESETLAKHNHLLRQAEKKGKQRPAEHPHRFYILDEFSLGSTEDAHYFLTHMKPTDRALFVGDRRQHNAIGAGRPFAQLQYAGLYTIKLEHIIRQRENPELLSLVKDFARGDVASGVKKLREGNMVIEIPNRDDRFRKAAELYSRSPETSIILSPDNRSRGEIDMLVRQERRSLGQIGVKDVMVNIFTPRADLYKEDYKTAAYYHPNDWVRYQKTWRMPAADEYAQVISVDSERNLLTVIRNGKEITYNPEKVDHLQVLERHQKPFSVGERIQLTSEWKAKKIANRTIGVIERLDDRGNATVRFDPEAGIENGRVEKFNLREHQHLDYGYTTTSILSQAMTVPDVIVQLDTGDSRIASLIDKRSAYVMFSRAANSLTVLTDKADNLERALSNYEVKPMALSYDQTLEYRNQVA